MTTLRRPADTAFSYTLTVKDSAGNLITPTAAPTVSMFTDTARTLGAVALTVTATAQPQVFTITGPATVQSQRYLKHLIPTALGVRVDADDDLLFEGVTAGVDDGLVTLAEVKTHLDLTGTSSHDDELLLLIAAATPVIEELVGPVTPRVETEVRYYSGGPVVRLRKRPILSVTTVAVGTTAILAYTPEAGGYEIDLATGVLRLPYLGYVSPGGRLQVVYTAGRAAVTPNIRKAALTWIGYWWSREHGGSETYLPQDGIGVAAGPMGIQAFERQLRHILGPDLRGPRVA